MNLSPLAFVLFSFVFLAFITLLTVALIGICSDDQPSRPDSDSDNPNSP